MTSINWCHMILTMYTWTSSYTCEQLLLSWPKPPAARARSFRCEDNWGWQHRTVLGLQRHLLGCSWETKLGRLSWHHVGLAYFVSPSPVLIRRFKRIVYHPSDLCPWFFNGHNFQVNWNTSSFKKKNYPFKSCYKLLYQKHPHHPTSLLAFTDIGLPQD